MPNVEQSSYNNNCALLYVLSYTEQNVSGDNEGLLLKTHTQPVRAFVLLHESDLTAICTF
jgi:hypothetical protein